MLLPAIGLTGRAPNWAHFLGAPSATLRKIKKTDRSDLAEMARAIAYHRQPDPERALRHMNGALAARPGGCLLP